MMQEILVVDDDRQNLGLVRHLLENEQITVQCATSGEEALRKLKKNTFDLMITDLNMPGLDGFELARKASVIAPLMPIVMFTGDMSPDVLSEAKGAGIITVLAKPFHPNAMLEAIRSVVGDRKERAACHCQ